MKEKNVFRCGVLTACMGICMLFAGCCPDSDNPNPKEKVIFDYSLSCTNILLEYATPVIKYTDEKGDTIVTQVGFEEFEKANESSFYGDPTKKVVYYSWKMPSSITYNRKTDIKQYFCAQAIPNPEAAKRIWRDNADSLTYCSMSASCVLTERKGKSDYPIDIPPKNVFSFSSSHSGKYYTAEEYVNSLITEITASFDSEGNLYWKYERRGKGSVSSIDSDGNLNGSSVSQ